MDKKIGIMSMQRIINYGSFLQAYGLKKMIESVSKSEVEFIDYRFGVDITNRLKKTQSKAESIVDKILKNRTPWNYLKKKNFFKEIERNLILDLKNIGVDKLNYDCEVDTLVIGSDEVFNCLQPYPVGYSKQLFGDGYAHSKIVSYAASFGSTRYEDLVDGNIEVILVDDGSPDKSGYIIDRLKEEDNRIVVIHQENHGVSSARNAGMAVASGEYITFVDGDDWVDANYVTYFVDLLEKSSCDVVMNKNNYSGCNDISKNNFSVISAEKAIEWIYLGDLFVAVWNKMYRRSVLEENYIKFNEKIWYGEGMLFNVEFLQHVNSVAVGESAVYHQTFNPDSAMRKFNLKSNLCGIKSLELQKEAWIKKNIDIEKAWEYHRYCFNRSIIDGLVRSNMILEYNETYKECVSNLRKNIFLPLKMEKSIKKKIMWCCYFISPRLMAIRKAIGFKKAAKTGGGIRNNVIIEKTAYILVPITGGAFA